MKRTHTYTAEDGTTFATAVKCKEHEDSLLFKKLAGLSLDDIAEALNRDNLDLSDAIERTGNIIAAKRRESGDLKRAKKVSAPDVAMENIKENMKAIS